MKSTARVDGVTPGGRTQVAVRARNCGVLPAVVLAVVLGAAAPRPADAQAWFPSDPPAGTFTDDFESGTGLWTLVGPTQWTTGTTGSCLTGTYLTDNDVGPGLAIITSSIPGTGAYNPADWENIRFDVEIHSDAGAPPEGQVGLLWGLWPDSAINPDGNPDAGYVFFFDYLADSAQPLGGDNRARWHFIRRDDDVNKMIAEGDVVLEAGVANLDSMYAGMCYRVRLETFCGGMRIQVRNDSVGSSWYTVFQWSDAMDPVLTPGAAGLYHGSPGGPDLYRFDDVEVSSWGSVCSLYTSGWSAWTAETPQEVKFKLLYDAALEDPFLARGEEAGGGPNQGRIDADATLLTGGAECGFPSTSLPLAQQWHQLVDLPTPIEAASGGNETALLSFLNPVADTIPATDMFTFGQPADENLLVAFGATPVANTLMAAYQWYAGVRGVGGEWDDLHDPAAACRLWYVVFITDGGESCADPNNNQINPDGASYNAASEWLNDAGAESFANPATGLTTVPVFTVGFGGGAGIQADFGELQNIATATGGQAYTAEDAGQLAAILYDVINQVIPANRSFLPVTVSPPPNTYGSGQSSDFLLTVPMFVPQDSTSVWDGHLYGFLISPNQPTPPVYPPGTVDGTGTDISGQIDVTQAEWDAGARLATQLTDSTGRNVFYERDVAGTPTRTALTAIKSNATLRTQFKTWLNWPGGVTDAEADQIVDWMALTTGHTTRPLGDIYHSQPVIIGPPSNFTYALHNIHNYSTDFTATHKFRRRITAAGANDGLLHFFDAGFYNRDTTNYPNQFDLGDGTELFSFVPRAVMNRLYGMTFGTEQQYLVDGNIATGDVFIDPGTGTREWRTVVVGTMRRGGRGLVALDVTQPDPYNVGVPVETALPGCTDGSTTGCNGDYPKPLWEFNAPDDTDENGDTEPDLGWTWSTPVIARVKKDVGGADPDDMYVVFFGGGWDRAGAGTMGTFLYGLDVATGNIIYKQNIGGDRGVPGGMSSLDVDDDGWIDRIYFGDTAGGLYRLDVTADATFTGGRVDNWTLTNIYRFGPVTATLPDGTTATRQLEFYMKPTIVPAAFSGGSFVFALAIGTGDRANVGAKDGVPNRFYFVIDDPARSGTPPFDESAGIHQVLLTDPNAGSGTSYLDPANGEYGWFLVLNNSEKVNADAIVANEIVQFPTFQPSDDLVSPTETPNEAAKCQAVGIGRLYTVNFQNADSEGSDRGVDLGSGLIGGVTDYTVGDETRSLATTFDFKTEETVLGGFRFHRVTNWRQD